MRHRRAQPGSASSRQRQAGPYRRRQLHSHRGHQSIAVLFNIPLAVFDKNQGEIARTGYAITQAQEQASETAQQVSTDVVEAYENLHSNDQIIQLYRGGYVDQAKKSRDIS